MELVDFEVETLQMKDGVQTGRGKVMEFALLPQHTSAPPICRGPAHFSGSVVHSPIVLQTSRFD